MFAANERGGIFPLVLFILFLLSGMFSFHLYTYERELRFTEEQEYLMKLENLLQLALSEVVQEDPLIEATQQMNYPSGEVRAVIKETEEGMRIRMHAELDNGYVRSASAVLDLQTGRLLSYKEPL
ncbi:competence type IV pilus minor pilin ComGG [Shouchella shacheensis]|uniref:competence type IV pilus minor pilin ComGG n=1 Tax=Shouchella shacheensis TaxID=1649580 RepID=UPI0007400B54|nr:competence type IV pilus minor pilin ComGG [Shouchella shacheensis]